MHPVMSKEPYGNGNAVASPTISSQFAGASSLPASTSSGERSTPTTLPTNGAIAKARAPAPQPLSSARSSPARGASSCWTRSRSAVGPLLLHRDAISDAVTHRRPLASLGLPAGRSRRLSRRGSCLKSARAPRSGRRRRSVSPVSPAPCRVRQDDRERIHRDRSHDPHALARDHDLGARSCRAGSRRHSRPERSRSAGLPGRRSVVRSRCSHRLGATSRVRRGRPAQSAGRRPSTAGSVPKGEMP